ncbi:MAG: ectonucleotide pyrophosphatase/phosphodiesterase, partial [Gemmatimonadales bacterium]|nr:ectonucleotide pyrophosphatase/phosphodiesterase [Gemmatimonadales bacterium]
MRPLLLASLVLAACAPRGPAPNAEPAGLRPRVVLISVDGLWAGDLRRAESAGVRLPALDSLRRAGAFAAGVVGSLPSVTFPSHTTIVTGVPPARHGVYANNIFVPPNERRDFSPAYLEHAEILVPTVFDAAHAAGLRVAAVFWPVTAHDPSIHYNIPDAWEEGPGARSQLAALRSLGTPWLLDSLGAPPEGRPDDSLRAHWGAEILRRWDPDFVAVHLIDLDHAKHVFGIWSDSAIAGLRNIDRRLGLILAAVQATDEGRRTTLIVTSDHGFLDFAQRLRPGVLLANAGLIRGDTSGVLGWEAAVHVSGGSVMILPRDSTDATLAARVRAAIPDSLVGPTRPIRAVWPRDTIRALAADPRAIMALDMNEGFYAVGGYTGAL